MNIPHRIGRPPGAAAFSLVEVSLAIAICAVGLLALVGLIPAGLNASRRAADDSLIASIASDIMQCRRISPYTNTTYYPGNSMTLLSPIGSSGTINLDAMGNTPLNPDGTVNTLYLEPYFLVTETIAANPLAPASPDTKRLLISIQWPCYPAGSSKGLPVTNNCSTRVFVSDYTRM
jgi:hypothetical protein